MIPSAEASASPNQLLRVTAEINAESAIKLPTDRSIPAVIITRVIPMAMMATGAFWLRIAIRFSADKNADPILLLGL